MRLRAVFPLFPILCGSSRNTPSWTSRRFFFFNDSATTEIYTFPTRRSSDLRVATVVVVLLDVDGHLALVVSCERIGRDRKSTRLNSSHDQISYAVFCLKK